MRLLSLALAASLALGGLAAIPPMTSDGFYKGERRRRGGGGGRRRAGGGDAPFFGLGQAGVFFFSRRGALAKPRHTPSLFSPAPPPARKHAHTSRRTCRPCSQNTAQPIIMISILITQ